MITEIVTISTRFVLNIFVNCYLVKAGGRYILIDTGMRKKRGAIEKALERAGCRPGDLELIVLTHGDFDHVGNAAYLRQKFGTEIAMHYDDSGMVQRGDMFWNRTQPNRLSRIVFSRFFGLRISDRFTPDLYVEDEYDFSGYGLDAKVLHIPGHSRGSIGILTADGKLFCGDLLGNVGKPELWSLIDDSAAANASVERLESLRIHSVYPGHGEPFPMELFIEKNR